MQFEDSIQDFTMRLQPIKVEKPSSGRRSNLLLQELLGMTLILVILPALFCVNVPQVAKATECMHIKHPSVCETLWKEIDAGR